MAHSVETGTSPFGNIGYFLAGSKKRFSINWVSLYEWTWIYNWTSTPPRCFGWKKLGLKWHNDLQDFVINDGHPKEKFIRFSRPFLEFRLPKFQCIFVPLQVFVSMTSLVIQVSLRQSSKISNGREMNNVPLPISVFNIMLPAYFRFYKKIR